MQMLEWSKTYVSNVAGEIAIVLALAMWVTSSYRIRRKMFEVFFYTHQLYILYVVFYVLHVGAAYFCMILPGIFLFIIDRYLRFLQSQRRARLESARLLPCGSIELTFSKSPGLYYNPTSIIFLKYKLSVVVKRQGSWSQKLYQQISSSVDRLEVSVEGPYGPTSSHFLRHELLVLNSADLAILDLLLPVNAEPSNTPQMQLQIEAYITREGELQTEDSLKLLRTIWFRPNQLDSPN
ncbi:putative proteinDPH OXIDASE [Salix purpurea]|uniref:Ferric oxidoreductase domain-containing protein n=1 Tax=Salix purpurea TaxID=77065 RepID=A0A9Q0USJ6_SALPP|nr:putative proteinDPH OXIDASE [Salix purpurea]